MKRFAVIGKDVSKSISPQIHLFIARELGVEICYDAISLTAEQFERDIKSILASYDGINVTIPYKLAIMPYLSEIVGDAAVFGAVNTVTCGNLKGYNTDGLGFMQMLGSENIEVSGQSVLVLGAGGAGRSVAKKLADAGARVEIYDVIAANAKAVADEFAGVQAAPTVAPEERYLIVNASGVGMHATEGKSPVGADVLALTQNAVDLIYVPAKSEFLKIAEGLGKKIVNGAAMLFYQAYYSDCYYFNLSFDPALAARLFKKFCEEKYI